MLLGSKASVEGSMKGRVLFVSRPRMTRRRARSDSGTRLKSRFCAEAGTKGAETQIKPARAGAIKALAPSAPLPGEVFGRCLVSREDLVNPGQVFRAQADLEGFYGAFQLAQGPGPDD